MTTEKHTITIPKCETEQQSWSCRNMKEYGDYVGLKCFRCDVCKRARKHYYEDLR